MRPTIQYRGVDRHAQPIWDVAVPLIRGLPLPRGSRWVIYFGSYTEGDHIAADMGCLFYKANATDKPEVLTQWREGHGGWIVATEALGTGIDIPRVIYNVHLSRPYGLTSLCNRRDVVVVRGKLAIRS